jgi:glycosyltransferase involved in cell wall biosynthesis
LVHIHNLHGYWINHRQILVGLAQLNIPTVWTLHDYWPITGHCAYFENVGCKKWQVGCRDCPQIRHYPKSYMDGSDRNFSEKKSVYDELSNLHIVAVSEHSRKIIGKSILASFPVTTIYNSIDTSVFWPATAALQFPGKTVVGCVAKKWDERKGLDDVIKLRKLLNESFIVLVVGLTGQQIRQLPPGIVGAPPTMSLEKLRALYSSMDVFFNPSREETFGMTTIEAMACGVPVVLYNVSANCEIQPEFMGIGIVENRNVGQAARAIMTIVTDADRLLRESLVQYVAEKYSLDTFLSAHYQLSSSLLIPGNS